jgi:two-component system, LytTR family, response regulator
VLQEYSGFKEPLPLKYHTLIVDDEPAACERLDRMLATLKAPCDIIGKAMNGFEALSMINETKPDLVFLDIELPGINGIEMLRHCSFDPYIIFTTAYDSYAIDAFEAKTISYLVKPISEARLLAAMNKLLKMTRIPAESLATILQPIAAPKDAAPLQLLPVKSGESISLLKIDSIIQISAEGKYSVIATQDKQYISNYSISELEERLGSSYFIRVHRSRIVNLKFVLEMRRIGIGKFKIILDAPLNNDIIVSKNYYDELKRRLKIE